MDQSSVVNIIVTMIGKNVEKTLHDFAKLVESLLLPRENVEGKQPSEALKTALGEIFSFQFIFFSSLMPA